MECVKMITARAGLATIMLFFSLNMQVCDVLVNLKLFVLHQLALKENMLLFSIVLSALVSQNYLRYCKNENN